MAPKVHRVAQSPLAQGQRTHLVALVRAGAHFERGVPIEHDDEDLDHRSATQGTSGPPWEGKMRIFGSGGDQHVA